MPSNGLDSELLLRSNHAACSVSFTAQVIEPVDKRLSRLEETICILPRHSMYASVWVESYSQTRRMGLAVRTADQLTPTSTTPGLIGKYDSPMECLGLVGQYWSICAIYIYIYNVYKTPELFPWKHLESQFYLST